MKGRLCWGVSVEAGRGAVPTGWEREMPKPVESCWEHFLEPAGKRLPGSKISNALENDSFFLSAFGMKGETREGMKVGECGVGNQIVNKIKCSPRGLIPLSEAC